jgi:molybdopterin molybdotransferase
VIVFDDACHLTAQVAQPLGTEAVRLAAAAGRRLAAPVVARRTAPDADTSAMDGYAVRDADLVAGASRLHVVGETFAGDCRVVAPLGRGDCARVFTGAPIPGGADRVVVQEDIRREGDLAVIARPPGPARHVRRAGSDFHRGDELLAAGALLTPQAMIAAAAADLSAVEVFARPRVFILSTGDELAEPGLAHARPGAIPESVSFGVAALAELWGAEVVGRRRLADRMADLAAAAGNALAQADVVVTTGGASVGERDFAKAMFASHGLDLIFEKVAMKPGKPVWLGHAGDRLVLGLPGNPSAAMVAARLFLAPLLAGLGGGAPERALAWRPTPVARPVPACGDRDTFHRAQTTPQGALSFADQDSSGQKTLAAADLLIRRRPGARALLPGDLAEVLTL